MKGMILAAGFGTRFKPHTATLPKPALPFLNIPLVYYSVFLAERFASSDIYFNTHHLPEEVERVVNQISKPKFRPHISYEAEILGSSGCMEKLSNELGDDSFFVLNADTVIIPSRKELLSEIHSFHNFEEPLATLLVMEHPEAGKKYGAIWVDPECNVVGFGKTPPPSNPAAKPFHFTGVRIFSPQIFDFVPTGYSDIFVEVLPAAIKNGLSVKAFVDTPLFLDGGDLQEFLKNTETAIELFNDSPYLQKVAKRFCPNFSSRTSPQIGIKYKGPSLPTNTMVGDHVEIHDSVQLSGFNVIGNKVKIGQNCTLRNTVIREGTLIPEGTVIENDLLLASPKKS